MAKINAPMIGKWMAMIDESMGSKARPRRSGSRFDTAYPRDWIRRIQGIGYGVLEFLGAQIRRIFLMDTAYWSLE
ncbi:hypothetical protein Tco_1237417 [Tanacetum coccineum]